MNRGIIAFVFVLWMIVYEDHFKDYHFVDMTAAPVPKSPLRGLPQPLSSQGTLDTPPSISNSSTIVFMGMSRRQLQGLIGTILTIGGLVIANLVVAATNKGQSSDALTNAEASMVQRLLNQLVNSTSSP